MKEQKASRTAMMVAYMRAVADVGATHVRDFRDPTARVYLNAKWTRRLETIARQVREKRQSVALAFATASADLLALRTKTIDAAVCNAIGDGTRQVVILGAGLDGRAWRMKELAGVRVFEIDHPATQAFKRARLNALPPMVGAVTFVALDFDRQGLDDALSRAGHDPSRPTCWIWEGVVMYLAPDTMRATLGQIARRSARDSTLIINYHTSMRSAFVRLVLRFIGEPVKSAWQPEAIAAELRGAGFAVIEDGGVEEWVARFAGPGVNTRVGRVMRIVVGRKDHDGRRS